MNIKRILVVVLVLAVTGWLLLGPDEETPDTGSDRDSGSGGDLQTLPREPEPLPQQPYGIAGDERPYQTAPRYGYGAPTAPYAPVQPQAEPLERYSFRPLTERERERLARERPLDAYGTPVPPAPPSAWTEREPEAYEPYGQPYGYPPSRGAYPPAPRPGPYGAPGGYAGPPGYGQPAPYPDWQAPGYQYRPFDPSPAASDRYQGAYPEPGWSRGPELADPWPAPPAPRPDWTPPAERMYPALDWGPDRKLTALD